ncbi:MAG: hypothetical protein H6739_42005 [Alphaproteobacteria bacterium]|nr:hypothetical protein [Alphaproteobacteria bacterium]
MSSLTLPLAQFPLPPEDPLEVLRREVEQNLPIAGGLPWMVMAGTATTRLAVVRTDLEPARCARVEEALALQPGVRWTALCGEAVLGLQGGALRHVFARTVHTDGRWEAAVRPFLHQGGTLEWLGGWTRVEASAADKLTALFPDAEDGPVRFVAATSEVGEPTDRQEIPEGATEQDIARMAGLWLESFFFAKGFVPPSVITLTAGHLEVRLLPRSGPRHAASDLAIRMAQEPGVEAVGVFLRGRDSQVQPPAEQITVRLEWRGGPALTWRRRFRVVARNTARWIDPVGEVLPRQGPRMWFT